MRFAKNLGYKVVITKNAKMQLARILRYLSRDLGSAQAARSVKADIVETKERLSRVAGSLKLCSNPKMRALGYRTIRLKRHRYFLLYKVVENVARVDGIYHVLQDFEKSCGGKA